MVRSLLTLAGEMLNIMPSDHGVSDTVIPAELVDGVDKFDFGKKDIKFGSYAQVYTGTDNTQSERCVEAIALRRSNEQNGHYFMNLRTGERITSKKWVQLPISAHVIDRVHELAQAEKRPQMKDKEMVFGWEEGVPINLPQMPHESENEDFDEQVNLERLEVNAEENDNLGHDENNDGHDENNDEPDRENENNDIPDRENEDNDALPIEENNQHMNMVTDDEFSAEIEEESYLDKIKNNAEYDEVNSREFEDIYEIESVAEYNELDTMKFEEEEAIEDINNAPLIFNDNESNRDEGRLEIKGEIDDRDITPKSGANEESSSRPKRQVRTREEYIRMNW